MLSEAYWSETVTVLLDAVARIHSELGITFEFINIGGGLGIPYRPGQVRKSAYKEKNRQLRRRLRYTGGGRCGLST